MSEASSDDRLLAGAMSGTSADGVDAAVVQVRGRGLGMAAELRGTGSDCFEPALRESIQRCRGDGVARFEELCRIGRAIVGHYVVAVKRACRAAAVEPGHLAAVAAHGQTLFHRPPDTIQWFDPAMLAAGLGCAVVSDFRRADLAAGGQGAPLVPFADYLLFRDAKRSRVLLNLGGIANITVLNAGADLDDVSAFDTGPGNCILDALCREHDPDGPGYDVDGAMASRGDVIGALLETCLADGYFSRPPPKSTDGPAMIALFERARRRVCEGPTEVADLLASAAELTARTIGRAIERHAPDDAEVIVAGGGVTNRALMERLRRSCSRRTVRRSDELGVPSSAREAMAFALLGAATLDGEPSNVPAATGARRRVVLGSITPAP